MPATLLDKIRAALKRPSPTPAQLADALADARRVDADARTAVERQADAVAAGYLDDDAKRAAARAKLADLRAAAEDAAAILAEVERRHGAVLAADGEAARRAAYDAAKDKADAVGATLAQRYTTAAGAIVALLRDLAEANAAIDAANADLPAGAAEIAHPETVARSTPGLPWMPEEVDTVELWAFADGTPVADAYLCNVVDYGGGRGSYKVVRVEGIDDVEVGQPIERRRFKRVTSYEPTAGLYLTELARSLRLPHLFADRNIIGSDFLPNAWTPAGDLVGEAEHRLSTMAKPPIVAAADRPKRVELRPVWSDAEVAKARSPAADYHGGHSQPSGTGSRFGASPLAAPGSRAGGRR